MNAPLLRSDNQMAVELSIAAIAGVQRRKQATDRISDHAISERRPQDGTVLLRSQSHLFYLLFRHSISIRQCFVKGELDY